MTPSALALQLLSLIGVRSLSLTATVGQNQPGVNQSDLDFCGICITQALQEVFALGPQALSQQEYSEVLRAPQPVTFTATQYSRTISAFATWQSWMIGCTIQGGDGEDNELVSATELVRPYMAANGSVSATVYNDALLLPSWIKNVIGPVDTPTVWNLTPEFRESFEHGAVHRTGSGRHPAGGWWILSGRTKSSSYPSSYMVEPRYDPTTGALPLIMRFNPMPSQIIPVTFMAARKPPVVTADDIITATGAATVTGTLSPNATGTYTQTGTSYGNPMYFRDDFAYILFSSGVTWILQAFSAGFTAQANRWTFDVGTTLPDGDYDPGGANTGTATVVSATSSPAITIPTDWHESILLPFAKMRFISHPSFNNSSVAQAIAQQYQVAKETLETFRPQISRVMGEYH